ncbi:protein kinase, partial [Escherichia coli]|nr:protein kinase [Escherichia coli]
GTIAKISEFSVAASVKYESQTDSYGTMPYLAPEVQQWQPYNTSADVYSFAIMLNEMLTKEAPYVSEFMESYSLRTKILQ